MALSPHQSSAGHARDMGQHIVMTVQDEHGQLEVSSLWITQPVQVLAQMTDVIMFLCMTDKICRRIQHGLSLKQVTRNTSQSRAAITDSCHDQ